MSDSTSFRILIEKVKAESEIQQIKLPVANTALTPVFSKEAIDLHYGKLYKAYVEKALAGEGEFQVAGAKLHTIFFEQFQAPKPTNNPNGAVKTLIVNKFGGVDKFKDSITKTALGIHGSGWVYLDTKGVIKTIANHKVVDNICILIDCWEHSYQIDYGADKEKYLKDIWRVFNWDLINARLNNV
jgi:Fe-Mn family superoxide dismutase